MLQNHNGNYEKSEINSFPVRKIKKIEDVDETRNVLFQVSS